jgi:hypothetical protein
MSSHQSLKKTDIRDTSHKVYEQEELVCFNRSDVTS